MMTTTLGRIWGTSIYDQKERYTHVTAHCYGVYLPKRKEE